MIAVGSGGSFEASDGWTIRTRDRGLASHYEDTVIITRGRRVVLTETAPCAAEVRRREE
jgi:methionine aminopeptidase